MKSPLAMHQHTRSISPFYGTRSSLNHIGYQPYPHDITQEMENWEQRSLSLAWLPFSGDRGVTVEKDEENRNGRVKVSPSAVSVSKMGDESEQTRSPVSSISWRREDPGRCSRLRHMMTSWLRLMFLLFTKIGIYKTTLAWTLLGKIWSYALLSTALYIQAFCTVYVPLRLKCVISGPLMAPNKIAFLARLGQTKQHKLNKWCKFKASLLVYSEQWETVGLGVRGEFV